MDDTQINFKRLPFSNPLIAAPLSLLIAFALLFGVGYLYSITFGSLHHGTHQPATPLS